MKDHNGKDRNPHLFKRALEKNYQDVCKIYFAVLGSGYRGNTMKRKVAEAMFIKELKLTLNIQEKFVLLKLSN